MKVYINMCEHQEELVNQRRSQVTQICQKDHLSLELQCNTKTFS